MRKTFITIGIILTLFIGGIGVGVNIQEPNPVLGGEILKDVDNLEKVVADQSAIIDAKEALIFQLNSELKQQKKHNLQKYLENQLENRHILEEEVWKFGEQSYKITPLDEK